MREHDMRVFPEARDTLDCFLAGLDQLAPGLVTGLHLAGSIALGDGRPGQSDIDLVMIRAGESDNASTMAALEPVLAELRGMHPAPVLDGLVLGEAHLAAGPDEIEGERPVVVESTARLDGEHGGWNPVTWQTLRQCGIAYRGTPLDPDRLWHDPARLDAWTRDNLESYWRPWLGQAERLAARDDLPALIDEATEWGVLGVTRLHSTLATGEIVSKHGAGNYALEVFPPCWSPIIEEAIRVRERRDPAPGTPDPEDRVRQIRAYMAMVIEDALALPRRTENEM